MKKVKWLNLINELTKKRVMEIMRANKEGFIYAMNHVDEEDVWGRFKRISGMSAHERLYFDKMLKEGIEHEEWMNGDKRMSPERWAFKEWLENRATITDEMLGISKPKERKIPLHPGKIAYDLLFAKAQINRDYFSAGNIAIDLDIECKFIERLFECQEDVNHILAYKLAKVIDNTDVAFWLCAQECYDEYMRGK